MSPVDDKLILTDKDLESEIRYFTGMLDIYSRSKRREILKALHWSRKLHEGQKRASGEPYIIHPIKVAEILIEYRMDPTTVIGALLHDVLEDTDVTRDDLKEHFGEEVAKLVDGVTKIDDMNIGKDTRNTASFRKMVWAMVDDIRVVFIKLSDKRHNMNTLQYITDDSRRNRIARECLEIYAPMAGKLGMSSLRSEFEDLSLKYLQPETYTQIKEHVAARKEERKLYLEKIQGDLIRAANSAGIKMQVSTRAKHFYSIYRKMKDRGKEIDEIYDLLGVRIICENTVACYTMLGVVHNLWAPLEGRFKDYIARPKSNGYQSLHTTVLTEGGQPLEIQIRTRNMHATAEYGIAAHWAYKERKKEFIKPEEMAVVQQLKALRDESYDEDLNRFLEVIKQDVLKDSIIVYTPKGDAIELPEGSTAIDLAYHIHSEIGDHCVGAKADGIIIPLTRSLENTQTIQILTAASAHPHVNWLKHVRSAKARSKIRNWLNKHDSDVIIDRNIVARKNPIKEIPKRKETAIAAVDEASGTGTLETQVFDNTKVGITIGDERNLMIKISKCCSPVPGDKIIGYISRGRGIVIHKADCPNLKGIEDFEERRIEVDWETASTKALQRFRIHSKYTSDLFSEIEGAIRKYGGHLISGNLDETDRGNLEGYFTVEVGNSEDFGKILKSIRAVPSVLQVTKVQNIQNRYCL